MWPVHLQRWKEALDPSIPTLKLALSLDLALLTNSFSVLKIRCGKKQFLSSWWGLVCTKGSNFLFTRKWITHPEVNGILYGRILTWWTEQLVNSSWRYVSATPVRKILSQELVETTILWATHGHFRSYPDVSCIKTALQLLPLSVILISTNFTIFEHILARLRWT